MAPKDGNAGDGPDRNRTQEQGDTNIAFVQCAVYDGYGVECIAYCALCQLSSVKCQVSNAKCSVSGVVSGSRVMRRV